ncbi:MAG TPA: efflux RND transporter periplasmic adaptor subunit [Bacteroidota bacterium]|nr:efflux RND transporter periplasmic adaptor subunit [Bacteroidota bacterium]
MTIQRSAVLTCMLCAAVLAGCNSNNEESEAEVRPRASVEVASATPGTIDNLVHATGSFQVLRDEKVKSTITGKVENVLVLEGDAVHKGQILAMILSQESNAAIAGAEQLLSQASTEAERARAETTLQLAQRTAAVARIAAPFDGAIVHRFVTEGELVTQGSDLVEIIDPKTEYFIANIPVNSVSSIKTGQQATVIIPALHVPPIRGTVQAINPTTDPNSQSVQVRISLGAVSSLVTAGTFGNVQIKVAQFRSVLLVPKSAVFHDDELDQYEVWRIQGDSLALITRVSVGVSDTSNVEITSGLRPGDIVATVGGYGLPDSTQVTVTPRNEHAE